MKLFHGTDCAANKSPPIPPVPTMSLHQLQELASRQQGQIETAHRLLMNQEQRFQYLCSLQDSQQGPIFEYDQHLSHFKEKVAQQEAKLKKLRLLKGQIQKQKCSNSNICSELETVKLLYKEKERELSVALTKIEALTRQLDELKKGNIPNNYSTKGYKHAIELEKLRQELLFKTKLFKKNEEELILKRNMLYKRQADILKIDKKIVELQSRLARKRQLNLQLSYRDGHQVANPDSILAQKWLLTQSNQVPYHKLANIATVEPLQRYKASTLEYDFPQFNFGASKQDPKYQTLPYNTKFGSMKNSCNYENQLKVENGGSGDNMSCDIARNGSLRINAKSETSEEALEERPSPSGSSGSSDRISTSLNSYTFSDKMAFNAISQHNHYYSQLDKYSHPVSENELFSRHYVPNSEFALTSVTQTKLEKDSSASSLDNHCKAKPSVPVKPLAALENRVPSDTSRLELMNSVGNGINSNNNYYAKRIHPTETFETARQSYYSLLPSLDRSPTKSDSTVPKLVHSSEFDEKQHEVENEDDNMRNHEIEQKSSVSEIVSKLNNLSSLGETKEWAKMRRRPVFSSNEMEKELERSPMRDEQCNPYSAYEGQENTDQIADSDHSNSKNRADSQDLVNNNDTREDKTNWTEESSDSRKGSDSKGVSDSPLKRLKGSLKRDEGRLSKIPLGRRVSFDPLALLLDAALEGELELVKKTSQEVSNPSASNDEGITALHNATCAGHFEIVKYLVEIGCDVNVQDSDGWTPLHCAASCNNLMMIKFLVKSGACVFATTCSDHETAAEKCEEDEEGFDGCSQYLYGIQDKLGVLNNGIVYALYDYESQNNDELSFKVSDRIQVLRKGDAQEKEWWWSKLYDREGYIPRNLIGLYPRIEPNRSKF